MSVKITDRPLAATSAGALVPAVQDGADRAVLLGAAAGKAVGSGADDVAAGDHGHPVAVPPEVLFALSQ